VLALDQLHEALPARAPLEVVTDAVALQEEQVVVVHVVQHLLQRAWPLVQRRGAARLRAARAQAVGLGAACGRGAPGAAVLRRALGGGVGEPALRATRDVQARAAGLVRGTRRLGFQLGEVRLQVADAAAVCMPRRLQTSYAAAPCGQ
jgi:hypothetical protein